MAKLVVHARTTNDSNGNPRRYFVVFGDDGLAIDVIDEGYDGSDAWKQKHPDAIAADFSFDVTPGDYKESTSKARREWITARAVTLGA